MDETGGDPIVAREASIVRAYELGARTTGIPASPTGTAGLAGLLERRSLIAFSQDFHCFTPMVGDGYDCSFALQ